MTLQNHATSRKHAFSKNIFSLPLLPLDCLCANDLINLMMFIIKKNVKTYTLYVPEYAVTYEDIIVTESREGNACKTTVTVERTSPDKLRFENEISTILHN